jgi:diphthine synthase
MSLSFVGLGSQPIDSLPYGALELLKKVDEVYIDIYTSPWEEPFIRSLSNLLGRELKIAKRHFLENVDNLLKLAQEKEIAIICLGDPFIATTHTLIRIEAIKRGIRTKVFYSSSFINVLFGELGLHYYKLGYVGTITDSPPANLISVYLGVKDSLERGRHSVLLLEYDYERNSWLKPSEAIGKLIELEKSMKGGLFEEDLALMVTSRVGYKNQEIIPGFVLELIKMEFGPPPHSLVIPAKLHFTEEEALKVLHKVSDKYIKAFGEKGKPLLRLRTEVTIKKTEKALDSLKKELDHDQLEKLGDLLENVDCYLEDAKRFLNEGKLDLALIEACYAEGLLDALRFQGFDIKW